MRVTLAEKLLLLLLAKLVNLVPDGGIWMNTQRPEWNDANNALVGRGLSVVTLAQLRRYVEFVRELVTADTHLTVELAHLLDAVSQALQAHQDHLDDGFTEGSRRAFMDDLGSLGSAYRQRVYAGFSGARTVVTGEQVQSLLDAALAYIDASLLANRREDALFHSYNILDMSDGAARIRRLPEMLEGQVAVLSSGELGAQESLALLAGPAGQRPVPRGPAQLHAVPGQGPCGLPRSQHVPGQSGGVLPLGRRPGRGGGPQPRGRRCARRPALRRRHPQCPRCAGGP